MDLYINHVTSQCPSVFSNGTGTIFAQTIAAMIAGICSITDGTSWPEDQTEKILKDNLQFDFIVVGAGTAGSLLASRLSDYFPNDKILLVEAGGDPGFNSEIPAFAFLNQDIDWNFRTEPNGKSCKASIDNSCIWPKGKSMGGSSSINAMIYVTGNRKDYDSWERMGNINWDYYNVKPYFDIIQNEFGIIDQNLDFEEYKLIYNEVLKAWNNLGFVLNKDNNESKIGVQILKLMTQNGKRMNTARVSINKAISNGNIFIMKEATVDSVSIDKNNKIATGVRIQTIKGDHFQIKARKEVILSAGTIGTPQILMLSGIGPSDHLKNLDIETVLDLPVGKNLQDHVMIPYYYQVTGDISKRSKPSGIMQHLTQYMLSRTGPLSKVSILDLVAFVSDNDDDNPNIQYHHTFTPKNDQFGLKAYFDFVRYQPDVVKAIQEMNSEDLLGVFPVILHPKSRGEVKLRDKNIHSKPIINANYFNNSEDLMTLVKAIRISQKLLQTDNLKTFGIKLVRLNMSYCEDKEFDTDDYWICYIEHLAMSIYHPVGTVKMGPKYDENSVVDHNLLIHGMNNLRVVDASIMPKIVSGNTAAATLMIAAKAADIIWDKYYFKDEL